MVELEDVNTNDPDYIKYSIMSLIENTIVLTQDFLGSRNVPDIVSIPISSEGNINESKNLKQEQI